MKPNTLISTFIIIVFFCFSAYSLAQEKLNFSIGFGLPELANVGVRYQIGQAQIGLSVGTIPSPEEKTLSVTGGVFFHFGNLTELSNLKPWYIMAGLAHIYNNSIYDNTYRIENYLLLTTIIGREFNISKKVGLYMDLGLIFEIKKTSKDNFPEPTEPTCCQGGPYEYPFIPAIGVGILFKL